MREKLEQIKNAALAELASPSADIEQIRVRYLGKKGELTAVLRGMGALTPEERPIVGAHANEVRAEIEKGDVTAVIIEGIQGVGGVIIPEESFLQELQTLCNATDTTLILDEIQSGCGRSGKFFAHQWAGIRPDMITQAKGIGNGFPIGVVLISPKFEAVYGELGTTFGGNHLACAATEAVLETMEEDNLLENVNRVGEFLMQELKKIEGIKEVRGRGLMIGIEFEEPIKEIRRRLLFEEHVFTGVSGTNVIRLLPPLTLSMTEAEEFIERFKKVLGQ